MVQLFRTKRVFKSPSFPGALRAVSLALLALGIYFLLTGPQDPAGNPSHILMWLFWWPLFVAQYLLLGRFWCAVCPFGHLGDQVRKACGLELPVPAPVKKYGPLIIGGFLLLIVWAEEAYSIQGDPWATAILLFVVMGCVAVASALFERRAWCRYMCPLGGMGVAYARVGMLQIRGNPDKCRTCAAASCYYGAGQTQGCPMNEFPRIKETNAYCIFCGNCVKTCPKDSAKVELRLPSRELWLLRKPGLYEAALCVLLGGVISATLFQHGFPEVLGFFERQLGYRAGYTLFFLSWQGAFVLAVALASQAATVLNGVSVRMNFSVFSYALIPLILSAHLAQGVFLLARGSGVLLDFLRRSSGLGLPPSLDPASFGLRVFQYALLAAGLVLSLAAARFAAETFFGRQRKIWVSIGPFWTMYVLLAGLFALVLSRIPGVLAASSLPEPPPPPGLGPLWYFLGFLAAVGLLAWAARPLLARRKLAAGRSEPARTLRMTVKNEASEIATAERALTRLAQGAGAGVKPIFDACTALEELMTYALTRHLDREEGRDRSRESYGTRSLRRLLDSRRPDLELAFTVLPDSIVIEMAQEGPPDNPLEALTPDSEEDILADSRSNRQIHRLRKYMSGLSYDRKNGRNVLTVVSGFEGEARPERPA